MAEKNQALAKALRTSSNEPQYIRGNLLPFKKDIKTKEVSFGMPTVAQGLIDALTAPYRAMKGEIDVDSPQGVQEALNFGLNFMGGGSIPAIGKAVPHGQLGITAYHGSPHVFDKFDIEKSGTGSGKNLFGQGIYTSELPKEAKGYMTSGSSGTINYNGKLMNRDSPRNSKDAAAYALHLSNGNIEDAIRSGLSTPEAISKIDYNKITPNGNLYKVDIPDELIPSMIKYGDSIGNQNQNVIDLANKNKEALNKILEIEKIKNPDANLNSIYDLSSSKLFRALGGVGNSEKAMLASGIGGVRYPSPVGGTNTVVFDPNKIKILERN